MSGSFVLTGGFGCAGHLLGVVRRPVEVELDGVSVMADARSGSVKLL